MGPSGPDERPIPRVPSDFPAQGPASLASIGQRAAARIIDVLLVALPGALAILPFLTIEGNEVRIDNEVGATAVAVGLSVLYETVLVGSWGRTLGKAVLGLRVARLVDGERPHWHQAAIRALLPASISVIPVVGVLSLGVYLSAALHPIRQGLHDRAAGTVVVRTR